MFAKFSFLYNLIIPCISIQRSAAIKLSLLPHWSAMKLSYWSQLVCQVSAFDADKSQLTNVRYSFAPRDSRYENLFMIQGSNGWITSLVPMDREKQAQYQFYVRASDEDTRGSQYSEAKVVVNLLDVNDCPPKFPTTRLNGKCYADLYLLTYICWPIFGDIYMLTYMCWPICVDL